MVEVGGWWNGGAGVNGCERGDDYVAGGKNGYDIELVDLSARGGSNDKKYIYSNGRRRVIQINIKVLCIHISCNYSNCLKLDR